MTKKLRENFFFILTTNIFTISLCFILYLINDGYTNDSPISNDAIHIAVPSIIICLLLFISAIIYFYIGQKDIVINNNISGNNTLPVEFASDKIEAMRQQYQQDLVRIQNKRPNLLNPVVNYYGFNLPLLPTSAPDTPSPHQSKGIPLPQSHDGCGWWRGGTCGGGR